MWAAQGILTSTGGMTCTRPSWRAAGKCCIAGRRLVIDYAAKTMLRAADAEGGD
jgi:hypothetical protein